MIFFDDLFYVYFAKAEKYDYTGIENCQKSRPYLISATAWPRRYDKSVKWHRVAIYNTIKN